jgi:hypothetical protein
MAATPVTRTLTEKAPVSVAWLQPSACCMGAMNTANE